LPGDIGAIDAILGFHIRLAHGAVLRHFGEHFAELGLTQKQVSVLWLTHDHPGIAQTDLARRLQMDRATTMAIVHALERRHLIARERAEDDRRRIGLALTEEGRTAFEEARAAIVTHEQWLKARFTKAEVTQLVALLRKIHD
jgi:DNA-binding MarR family transcriptional regulator